MKIILNILVLIATSLQAEPEMNFKRVRLSSKDILQTQSAYKDIKEKLNIYNIGSQNGVELIFSLNTTDITYEKKYLASTARKAFDYNLLILDLVEEVKANKLIKVPAYTEVTSETFESGYFAYWWYHYKWSKTTITHNKEECYLPYLEMIVYNTDIDSMEIKYKETPCP